VTGQWNAAPTLHAQTGAEIKAGFMAAGWLRVGWQGGGRVSAGYGCATSIALSSAGHLETERTVTMATFRPA